MKKSLWVVALSLCALTLAGCNCNCKDWGWAPFEVKQFCLDKGWTYSRVTSPDEVYWECIFPSGVGCRDEYIQNWECEREPNTESIDTEEKRFAGCEENVQWWMSDMVYGAENVSTEWGEESEWWASFVRNWVVSYTKDWFNWTMEVECVADFVDGSLGVSFGDEIMHEEAVEEDAEEIVEEVAEEIVEDEIEEVAE